jgi:hypothetical protein
VGELMQRFNKKAPKKAAVQAAAPSQKSEV